MRKHTTSHYSTQSSHNRSTTLSEAQVPLFGFVVDLLDNNIS